MRPEENLSQLAGTAAGSQDGLPQQEAATFECSRAQQRFWVLAMSAPGDSTLNVAMRYRLRGRVVPQFLEKAFNDLIARHEILRTRFGDNDGVPFQVVLPKASIQMARVDLSLLQPEKQAAELERASHAEATAPFDLAHAPLIRATLLIMGEEEHVLLLTVHHIACDGWSMGILSHELLLLYDAASEKKAAELPPLRIQYLDFAAWQNGLLENGIEAERRYWTGQLEGVKPFALPTDFARGERGRGGEMVSAVLPREMTDAMHRLGQAHGTTFFAVCASGLASYCRTLTGQDEVVFGTQVAGRDQPEAAGIIGPFINTVPLRFDLSGDLTFESIVERAGRTIRDAIAHQQMPLEDMIRIARPARTQSQLPLFTINMITQRAFTRTERGKHFELSGLPSVSPGSIYDLNLIIVERQDGWRMTLEYDPALFRRETAERHFSAIRSALERYIANPSQSAFGKAEPPVEETEVPVPTASPVGERTLDIPEALESRLGRIWQDVLGVETAAGTDNFFDLGGHSLLAFRLLAKVRKEFDVALDLQSLYEHPTLAELAKRISSDQDANASVVALQPAGTNMPIFALHNTLIYRGLADKLGKNQPFLAVPMPADADDTTIDYTTFAAGYVAAIRRARPNGPYILMGLCFAGRLAVEAARQLREAGQDVPLIIAIDAWAPGHMASLSPVGRFCHRWSYRVRRLLMHLSEMRRNRVRSLTELADRSDVARRAMIHTANRFRRLQGKPTLTLEDEELARIGRIDAACHATRHGRFQGDVLVLKSGAQPEGLFLDRALGWGQLASGRVEFAKVPGNHLGIFQAEGVNAMTALIAKAIGERQGPRK